MSRIASLCGMTTTAKSHDPSPRFRVTPPFEKALLVTDRILWSVKPRSLSLQILVYVERSMKNAKNINLPAFFDQIRNPVVPIQKNTNIALGFRTVSCTYLREIG